MKNLKWALLLFIIYFTKTACYFDHDDGFFDRIEGEGPVITQSLPVEGFTGIKFRIADDLYITQGDNFSVEIKGQENIIDLIDQDVRNGIWEIEFEKRVRNYEKLEIFITMPEIEYLSLSGSGYVRGQNTFKSEDIEVRISGSGDMDLGLESDDIEGRIAGSGKLFLEGIAQKLDFKISGSGDLRAFDLLADRADLEISGSGDMEVTVKKDLDVQISGSGDVFYKGDPDLTIRISGTGDVINAN